MNVHVHVCNACERSKRTGHKIRGPYANRAVKKFNIFTNLHFSAPLRKNVERVMDTSPPYTPRTVTHQDRILGVQVKRTP